MSWFTPTHGAAEPNSCWDRPPMLTGPSQYNLCEAIQGSTPWLNDLGNPCRICGPYWSEEAHQWQNPGGDGTTLTYCEDVTIGCQFDSTDDDQSNVLDVVHVVSDILDGTAGQNEHTHKSSDLNSDQSLDVLDVIAGISMIADAHRSCTIMSHTSEAICNGNGSDLDDFPYGPCVWCPFDGSSTVGTCMNAGMEQYCGGRQQTDRGSTPHNPKPTTRRVRPRVKNSPRNVVKPRPSKKNKMRNENYTGGPVDLIGGKKPTNK